jgi:ferredoxin
MIVADRKPLEEILKHTAGREKILVLGCGGCVTVCASGGDRQAELLASQLRLAARQQGRSVQVTVKTPTRQCDREFLDPLRADIGPADAIVSLACGVGVQLLAEVYEAKPVFPALNTTFMGAHTGPGTWTENCRGCGQCVLAETGGICPVARCAKSLVNGACGGTNKGKCEVSKDIDCAWYLIYKRLKARGDLSFLRAEREPLDWGKSSSGIRRTLVHAELTDEAHRGGAENAEVSAEKKKL